jgi:hypothetical protein
MEGGFQNLNWVFQAVFNINSIREAKAPVLYLNAPTVLALDSVSGVALE